MGLKHQIREFMRGDLLLNGDAEVGDEENLLVSGVLDSLALMRLVMHLEDLHDIEIPPRDITLEHFASLATMSDYLTRRLGAQSG